MYHFHLRKRIHQKKEKFPSPNKWKRFIDNIIYFVGMVGPIMTIPQVWNIWIEQNASGVSPISWSAYLIVSMFWLTYGITHKEKPIIFTQSL